MPSDIDVEGAVGAKAPAPRAPVADRQGVLPVERAFLWDWPTFSRCGRAFLLSTVVVFVVGVAVGALVPGLPTRVLNVIQSIVLWPSDYFSQLIPIYLLILLGNMKAALLTALLGPFSVWLNAKLNSGHPEDVPTGSSPMRRIDRLAEGVAAATIRAGRLVFPEIGDDSREFAARSSAGLAAVVPFLALWMNGAVLGLWLAEGLLGGWGAGLARVGAMLLPHGPVEFVGIILSAVIGLKLARELVPMLPQHDSEWQCSHARRWLTSDALAQSLGLLVGLLAIAAALEIVPLV
jgi:uncharacterized membrane protein SpoIIM required for sporulation